jgi:hypothetical protein
MQFQLPGRAEVTPPHRRHWTSPSGFECQTSPRTTPYTQPSGLSQCRRPSPGVRGGADGPVWVRGQPLTGSHSLGTTGRTTLRLQQTSRDSPGST